MYKVTAPFTQIYIVCYHVCIVHFFAATMRQEKGYQGQHAAAPHPPPPVPPPPRDPYYGYYDGRYRIRVSLGHLVHLVCYYQKVHVLFLFFFPIKKIVVYWKKVNFIRKHPYISTYYSMNGTLILYWLDRDYNLSL